MEVRVQDDCPEGSMILLPLACKCREHTRSLMRSQAEMHAKDAYVCAMHEQPLLVLPHYEVHYAIAQAEK
jgi:hypothetical protein